MLCPRNCRLPRRAGSQTYCLAGEQTGVATVCIHTGEEPPVNGSKGICNVFFSGCNLSCIYCQNHQISRNIPRKEKYKDTAHIVYTIETILETGIPLVGFVSPTHRIPQMVSIIQMLKKRGCTAGFVYNSNGYDKTETLRLLEGLIDVYLPDFKYADNILAQKYSDAPDYFKTAMGALKEMYRQKSHTLIIDKDGYAAYGIIVRHLVIPGHVENSINVLRAIAAEVSNRLHISLMSQYYPAGLAENYSGLNRNISEVEYNAVKKEMDALGFQNGWTQNIDSAGFYHPDFEMPQPFKRI